jgi:hypothetical protein
MSLLQFSYGASSSLIVISCNVPVDCILWLNHHHKTHYLDIPGLDNNVFKLYAVRRLKPRQCAVIDRLPERSSWVKIFCVPQRPLIRWFQHLLPSAVFARQPGDRSLNRPKEEWQHFVPTYPTPLAWAKTAQLELEEYIYGTRKIFRSSYVNTLKCPEVPVAMFSPYNKLSNWTGVRISERPFHLMQRILGFPLPYLGFGDLCTAIAAGDKKDLGLNTSGLVSNNRETVKSTVKSGWVE